MKTFFEAYGSNRPRWLERSIRAPATSMELPAAAGDGGTPPACGAGVDPDPHRAV